MKFLIYIFSLLIIPNLMIAQTSEKETVKSTIETFFEGFHKGDTTMMKSVLADKVVLQSTYINKKGKSVLRESDINRFIISIANRPSDQKWDERLLDFSIQIDGIMANAWVPYEFWANDTFSHCGVNSFQLYKDDDTWKIIYLIDTRRREACN